MKITKLGLCSIIVATLGVNAYSADTLLSALTNGKVTGQVKAYYFDRDKVTTEESITSVGLMLKYVSKPFYGLSLGLRFQSSNSPWANAKEKALFKADLYGPGVILEESYVNYRFNKTSIKAGRQFINTPLLAGNGSRIIHESFEGYTADIRDIPKTRLFVGYIDKYLTRTNFLEAGGGNGVGNFGKNIFMFGKKYAYKMGDSVWTVLAVNKSISGLKLTGQYVVVKDAVIAKTSAPMGDISVGLVQADYKLPIKGLNVTTGIQYGSSKVAKDDSRSGDLVGFKVATKYKGLAASLGYVVDNSKKAMVSGVGISTNWAYAGDIIGLENYNKDVNAISLNLKYNFASVGLKNLMVMGRYTNYMNGSNAAFNSGKDLNAYDFIGRYAFKGTLKGLSAKFHYEGVDFETGKTNEYRLYLDYKF